MISDLAPRAVSRNRLLRLVVDHNLELENSSSSAVSSQITTRKAGKPAQPDEYKRTIHISHAASWHDDNINLVTN
jgi:phosphopantetheinyl transferase